MPASDRLFSLVGVVVAGVLVADLVAPRPRPWELVLGPLERWAPPVVDRQAVDVVRELGRLGAVAGRALRDA